MTEQSIDGSGRDGYEDGVLDALEALLRETAHTTTQTDILMAAFDSNRIPSPLVHEARDRCRDTDIDQPGEASDE